LVALSPSSIIAATVNTDEGVELKQRAAKRRSSTLWQSVQQRDPHQISQQQSLGSYNRG